MATWAPHTLVTFGGSLNVNQDPVEIWQCGVRVMAAGGAGPLADHDAYLASVAPNLSNWFNTVASNSAFPPMSTLNWVKANPINAAGHYSDTATHVHDYAPHVAGGNNTPASAQADILCLCISWETARAIRKGQYATHGRIYPPNYWQSAAGTSVMRVQASVVTAWAAKGQALLTVLSGPANPCIPVVASGHSAEFNAITGVRVGDVMDVQRRRKDALKEAYTGVPFGSG